MSKKTGKRHSGQVGDPERAAKAEPITAPASKSRAAKAQASKAQASKAQVSKAQVSKAKGREAIHPPSSAAWARSALRHADPGFTIDAEASFAACAAEGVVTVASGEPANLGAIDPNADGGLDKAAAKEALLVEHARIQELQERLYAEHRRSLLVVFQAIDTGGKDGTIRSVFEGVNPQGCRVWSFKVPSADERDHDFLWRYHAKVPGRGMIGVFNRSHYEDVLVVRVKSLEPESVWRPRYDLINDFERMLGLSGVTVLKFFLHISKDEQKERLEARIADPQKHWKFDAADLVERQSWDAYQEAFTDALGRCSTPHAPWHVVPANRKWYRNLLVARTIANTLEAMDPRYPDAQPGIADLTVPD